MLSDRARWSLEQAVKITVETFGVDACMQYGPTAIIDVICEKSKHADLRANVSANREEAIRIVGAILGCM